MTMSRVVVPATARFLSCCPKPFPKVYRPFSSKGIKDDASVKAEEKKAVDGDDGVKSSLNLEKELANVKDSYLRLLADMENLRERTRRDVQAAQQFAIGKFAKDVLGIADVLEMALKSTVTSAAEDAAAAAAADGNLKQLKEGLELTMAEAVQVLARNGVTEMSAVCKDAPFDPNLMEALYEVPGGAKKPGLVVSVQKRGYFIHDRVLRAAQVAVSK